MAGRAHEHIGIQQDSKDSGRAARENGVLLVAESTENMLQTILSRVQIHRMERLKEDEIADH